MPRPTKKAKAMMAMRACRAPYPARAGSSKAESSRGRSPGPEMEAAARDLTDDEVESDIDYTVSHESEEFSENAFALLNGKNATEKPEPCRQTVWRHKKRKEEDQKAAIGSKNIADMFAAYRRPGPSQVRIVTAPPTINEARVLAITELQTKMGQFRVHDREYGNLNKQTKQRHQAVLAFLQLQVKEPVLTRKECAHQVARMLGKGFDFSRSIVHWERSWIETGSIPEGKRGVHAKISSIFNDEDVALFTREKLLEMKENISPTWLAQWL